GSILLELLVSIHRSQPWRSNPARAQATPRWTQPRSTARRSIPIGPPAPCACWCLSRPTGHPTLHVRRSTSAKRRSSRIWGRCRSASRSMRRTLPRQWRVTAKRRRWASSAQFANCRTCVARRHRRLCCPGAPAPPACLADCRLERSAARSSCPDATGPVTTSTTLRRVPHGSVELARALSAAVLLFAIPLVALAAEIKLLSAGALTQPLAELIPQFERASNNKVTISYGTAGTLRAMLERGEPADLVMLPA